MRKPFRMSEFVLQVKAKRQPKYQVTFLVRARMIAMSPPKGLVAWVAVSIRERRRFRTLSGCHQPDERPDRSVRGGDAGQSVNVRLLPVDETALGRARPGKSQSRNITSYF